MNYINHLNFAKQILKCCGLDERAAYFANLPAFINRGPYYNSMFTHALSHLPDMLEVANNIFSSLEQQGQDVAKTRKLLDPTLRSLKEDIQNSTNFMQRYHYKKRLLFYNQILSAAREISDQYTRLAREQAFPASQFYKDNQVALFLSFVSYIYFDLWVNPRQLFFPTASICSGSWNLWEEIDFFQLTEKFFGEEGEVDICSELYRDTIWQESLDSFAVVKGMIIRMGEMGSPAVAYSVVDWNIRIFLRYLGLNEYKRVDAEMEFLKKHESLLEGLFGKVFKKQ